MNASLPGQNSGAVKRVLLLEDDPKLSDLLTRALQAEGMAVGTARSMPELEGEFESSWEYDAILMDRLINGSDSRHRLPQIKKRWPRAAVLVLSAINTPLERAELINAGADDYLGKPFLTQELLARLRSLLRRSSPSPPDAAYRELGNSVLHVLQRTVAVGPESVSLPAKEFLVLKLLADDPGRVISRNELLDSVWGIYAGADTNVVEATITNLRRRLNVLGSTLEIKNMRNSGYWLEA